MTSHVHAKPAIHLGCILGGLPSGGPYRRSSPTIRGPLAGWIEDIRKAKETEEVVAPKCHVVSIKNAIAFYGLVFSQSGTLVRESLINRDGEREFLGLSRTNTPNVFAVENAFPPPSPIMKGKHVLLAQLWDGNYGHWVVEGLPRMAALRDVVDFTNLKFVVNAQASDMMRVYADSLRYYGVSAEQLVPLGAQVQPFEELIYPTPLTVQPWVKAPLAVRALENLANRIGAAPNAPKRIFLGRREEERRHLTNRPEVREFFLKNDYVEVFPATMTFEQQVRVFSGAQYVAGVLGAECTNVVFSPSGLRFLGLAPDEMQDDFFWDLVSHKSGSYFCLHGVSQDRSKSMNSPFSVDLAGLMQIAAEFDGDSFH
jgi:capsular polysaccharide biosynthesis protein